MFFLGLRESPTRSIAGGMCFPACERTVVSGAVAPPSCLGAVMGTRKYRISDDVVRKGVAQVL